MIVEGVHYLASDPPADVAWKLLAVNLSDLASASANPLGVVAGYCLGDDSWDRAFVAGLHDALAHFDVPLLGGDTVHIPSGSARVLAMTAFGEASDRGGARGRDDGIPGEDIWVSGTIGDAGAGLAIAMGREGPDSLLERYRRPTPRLELGHGLRVLGGAIIDVSDGLLIDATRLAEASDAAIVIDVDAVPLSHDYVGFAGDDREARLRAATSGDDYELLFSATPDVGTDVLRYAEKAGVRVTRIGYLEQGCGLRLHDAAGPIPLPERLGYEHAPS